jgi:hypothetical protein
MLDSRSLSWVSLLLSLAGFCFLLSTLAMLLREQKRNQQPKNARLSGRRMRSLVRIFKILGALWTGCQESLGRAVRSIGGKTGRRGYASGWPVILFALLVGSAIVSPAFFPERMPTTYTEPFGVQIVRGNHAYQFVNLKTGELREMRFCHDYNEQLFTGFVLTKLVVIETGPCEWLGRADLHYDILRDPNDPDGTPLLPINCHHLPETTVCDGPPKFTLEALNARQSARQMD